MIRFKQVLKLKEYNSYVNELWNYLEKFNLSRDFLDLSLIMTGKHTSSYIVFNFNLMRAFLPLKLILNETDVTQNKYPEVKKYTEQLPLEMVLIILVSSLEVYLSRVFIDIISYFEITDLNEGYRKKFQKKFKIKENALQNLEENEIIGTKLFIYLKNHIIPFQQTDICKLTFNAVNISLPLIVDKFDPDLWRRIFSKDKEKVGYIDIRNKIVHKGILYTFNRVNNINYDLIKNVTQDIGQFVYLVEKEILSQYPIEKYVRLYFK